MSLIVISSVKETRLRRTLRAFAANSSESTVSGTTVHHCIVNECNLAEEDDILGIAKQLLIHGYVVYANAGEVEEAKAIKKPKPALDQLDLTAEYTVASIHDEEYILNRRLFTQPSPVGNGASSSIKANASTIAVDLRKKIMSLYGTFLHADGSGVDYEGAAKSKELHEYGLIAEQLRYVDVANLEHDIVSLDERRALYLNLYNALVIHGHIALGNPKTPEERTSFFTKTAYDVGDEGWTLDVIEHGFLRCNRKKPFATKPVVDPADARVKHAMPEPVDPRIHFALNCGAKSCPPIRFYSTEKLNDQLEMAAKGFFKDDSNILILPTDKKVKMTKLLEWYGSDFAEGQLQMLQVIAGFLEGDKRKQLDALIAGTKGGDGPIGIEFYAYDWSENGASPA
jgi:hypothetical protein